MLFYEREGRVNERIRVLSLVICLCFYLFFIHTCPYLFIYHEAFVNECSDNGKKELRLLMDLERQGHGVEEYVEERKEEIGKIYETSYSFENNEISVNTMQQIPDISNLNFNSNSPGSKISETLANNSEVVLDALSENDHGKVVQDIIGVADFIVYDVIAPNFSISNVPSQDDIFNV